MPKTAGLKCPSCKKAYTVHQLLSSSKRCWPNQRWIDFFCKACEDSSKLEVARGSLEIGDIDGAPGPCFFADEKLKVPDLTYSKKYDGLEVKTGGKTYQFSSRGRSPKRTCAHPIAAICARGKR